VLFGRWSQGVAVVIVLTALSSLATGFGGELGIDLCWLRRFTSLPCPGCGMTRAVLRLAHGDVAAALRLHPFSLLVLPFAVVTSTSVFWSAPFRSRLRAAMGPRQRGFERVYGAVVGAFLAFGLLRLAAVALGIVSSP
jgi:hypothetical protein